MEREKQKATRIEIGDLIERHCKECSTVTMNRKKYGQFKASTMCTTDCTIGKKLFELGQSLLTGRTPKNTIVDKPLTTETKKVKKPLEEKLIREKYLELSSTMPDYKIANQFNVSAQTLKRRKKEWGLTDKRRNPAKAPKATRTTEKKRAGRPPLSARPTELIKTAELPPSEGSQQPQISNTARVTELEKKALEQEGELLLLKAENERLHAKCDEQHRKIVQIEEGRSADILHDFLRFMLTTRNEEAAENAKRALRQLGVDLDYRVRSGIIQVTADVSARESILGRQEGDDSHADTSSEN